MAWTRGTLLLIVKTAVNQVEWFAMKRMENPFQPPIDVNRSHAILERQKLGVLSQIISGLIMLFIPALFGIATIAIGQYLDKTLGWDERYVSLFSGFPPAMVAICLSILYWKRRHRLVATVGVVLWSCVCAFAILATIAFWGG